MQRFHFRKAPISHVYRMGRFLCSYTFLWHFLCCDILGVGCFFSFFSFSCHIPDLPLFLPDNSGWDGFDELVVWGLLSFFFFPYNYTFLITLNVLPDFYLFYSLLRAIVGVQ